MLGLVPALGLLLPVISYRNIGNTLVNRIDENTIQWGRSSSTPLSNDTFPFGSSMPTLYISQTTSQSPFVVNRVGSSNDVCSLTSSRWGYSFVDLASQPRLESTWTFKPHRNLSSLSGYTFKLMGSLDFGLFSTNGSEHRYSSFFTIAEIPISDVPTTYTFTTQTFEVLAEDDIDIYDVVNLYSFNMSLSLSNDLYSTGYENGYSKGASDVVINDYGGQSKDQIYNQGYNAGKNSMNIDLGVIGGLFSAIADIPIVILNGLFGFTLWGTPFMSIAMTLLAMSVVLWVIKFFIS